MAVATDPGRLPTGLARLRVAHLLGLTMVVPLLLVLGAVTVGIVTLSNESSVRDELINRIEPANAAALSLGTAVVDQETGIRGYELAAIPSFLGPYTAGRAAERRAIDSLRRLSVAGTARALDRVVARADAWNARVALPAIAAVKTGHPRQTATVDAVVGKQMFDAIRTALAGLAGDITARLTHVKHELNSAARTTDVVLVLIGVVLVLAVVAVALTLTRSVRGPLERLAASSRQVAGGELSRTLQVAGPVEIAQVSRDVDTMRQQLVQELGASRGARDELAATAIELERSNSELEQFAYIASHDLQEPLRKVTSFCQLLQDRYAGKLDERGDTYIEFAVDGAQRMQQLINDLLSFSRVGRIQSNRELVDLSELARSALADLEHTATETGGRVAIGDLPQLWVVSGLMRAVFSNLIANSLKFHRDAVAPEVRIQARAEDDRWLFECADNGIGIDPEYAERIFVIFQRLHARDRYQGTGIGLAMCRKIVEYHGGEIWLDTAYRDGARIRFTLPAAGSETIAA